MWFSVKCWYMAELGQWWQRLARSICSCLSACFRSRRELMDRRDPASHPSSKTPTSQSQLPLREPHVVWSFAKPTGNGSHAGSSAVSQFVPKESAGSRLPCLGSSPRVFFPLCPHHALRGSPCVFSFQDLPLFPFTPQFTYR